MHKAIYRSTDEKVTSFKCVADASSVVLVMYSKVLLLIKQASVEIGGSFTRGGDVSQKLDPRKIQIIMIYPHIPPAAAPCD